MWKEYEATIVIIGESDSGKSTLMNLIAGKPIQGDEYTCTYQDEDTHRTWKLHLLDAPAFRGGFSDTRTVKDIEDRLDTMEWEHIRGIIYCHNINQLQLDVRRALRPIDILKKLCKDEAMDNIILCTTQWDMLVDKMVGERTVNYLNNNFWNEALDLGARLARHDNTRRSVEEILGLILGQEAIIPLLLEELGRTEVEENIANLASASDDTIGDALVLGVKLLEGALPGDAIANGQEYINSASMGLNTAHNSDANSNDFVPLQFKPFAGEFARYAISHELASKKIQNVRLLLDALNNIFDTNVSISYPGIQKTLEYLINEGHDLGVIYAHLQVIWPMLGVPLISSKPLTDDNPDYIIGSPELAFRKYEDVDELLSSLNMSFDTEILRSKLGVEHVLRFFVDGGYKFGDICAHMRYTWPRTLKLEREWIKVWASQEMNLGIWEDFLTLDRRGKEHEDQRQKSLHDDAIHDLDHIKPRRIWDLYAYRIIPFQFSSVNANAGHSARSYLHFGLTRLGRYHPVSHSWTEDMSPIDSPVNAYEWPIPLPGGVTLEAVRNELLNLGAQYVWLDVVCLRQESSDPKREAIRMQEWKIDVPTIGKVYKSSPSVDNVIRYLNGLGKAFRRSGWKDKRHWSQRAWTVQEVSNKYIEAGLPEGVEDLLAETDETGTQLRDHLKINEIRLDSREPRIQNVITAMKGRHSQNPMDKIFGLSTLLECTVLPTYSKDEHPEQAWDRLLKHVSSRILAELLFTCPLPGENGCYWRPSWRQLMEDTVVFENVRPISILVGQVEDGHLRCSIALIKGCRVTFDCPSMSTVVLKAENEGKEYQWTMNKPHTQAIALGEYTLAGYARNSRWVLCKSHPCGELEKVFVFHPPSLHASPLSDLSNHAFVDDANLFW